LLLILLLGSLAVDHFSEGIFEDAGNVIASVDEDSDTEANDGAVVDCKGEEVDGGTVVHGAAGDVEGETGDLLVEKEAKVITEISADEAKTDVGAKNEDITDEKKNTSDDVDDQFKTLSAILSSKDVLNRSETGLLGDHLVVDVITGETKDEDDDTVDDARKLAVATEELSQELGLVLCAGHDVPHERVEQNVCENQVHERICQINRFLEVFQAESVAESNSLAFHCTRILFF